MVYYGRDHHGHDHVTMMTLMTKQYHMIPSTNPHSKFKQTLDQASTGTGMSKDFSTKFLNRWDISWLDDARWLEIPPS